MPLTELFPLTGNPPQDSMGIDACFFGIFPGKYRLEPLLEFVFWWIKFPNVLGSVLIF